MEIAVLGIDLGKNSCSVVGLDGAGQVVMRRRMQRDSVIKFASGMAPCVVAMEPAVVLTTLVASCVTMGIKCG
jgi:transposase